MKYLINISDSTEINPWGKITTFLGVYYTTSLYLNPPPAHNQFIGMVIDATDEEMVMMKLKFNIHIAGNSKLLFAQS